ncbi:hypothetical protein GOODEAATRI_003834 [Goodea atripinnis]|uniref:Uncharacterized protein n=1 Tax=Goodea atripinnis TaxID=208336 RepID=A0ABV0PKS3_9TELE
MGLTQTDLGPAETGRFIALCLEWDGVDSVQSGPGRQGRREATNDSMLIGSRSEALFFFYFHSIFFSPCLTVCEKPVSCGFTGSFEKTAACLTTGEGVTDSGGAGVKEVGLALCN